MHSKSPRVVVVGSGPAGAAAALYLARAGLSVTVLDAQEGVKDPACGEGIMPAGMPVLDELGVLQPALARGARRFRGITYHSWQGRVAAGVFPRSPGGPSGGMAVARHLLDELLSRALAAEPTVEIRGGWLVTGILVEDGRVVGVEARERGTAARERFAADLTIGADGLRSRFHQLPGVQVTRPSRRRFGMRVRLEGVAGLGESVEVHLASGAELYVTPVDARRAAIALLIEEATLRRTPDPRALFHELTSQAPCLAGRLVHARIVDAPHLKGPLGLHVSRTYGPGWLLVGDAAGALDPVTGEGVSLALCGARALGIAVERFGPTLEACRAAAEARRSMERPLRVLTAALLKLVQHPALAERTVQLMRMVPSVFSFLLGVAAHRASVPQVAGGPTTSVTILPPRLGPLAAARRGRKSS